MKPFCLKNKLHKNFFAKPSTKLHRNVLSNFGDKSSGQTAQDLTITHSFHSLNAINKIATQRK